MEKMCAPVEEGGLGLRQISDVAKAFTIKLWWRFKQNNSLWAKCLHAKYYGAGHPSDIQKRNTASKV